MNKNLGGLAGRNVLHTNQFDALRERAADLRHKADSLLSLQAQIQSSNTNLDQRSLDLDTRERDLRRREARLAQAEQDLSARDAALTHEAVAERFSNTLTVLNDLEEPVVGSPTSLAASIVRCGAVRRGEIS